MGFCARPPERLGDQEAVRQADLRRLVELARELDDGVLTLTGFAEELERRFGREAETRGVNLLTYHAAKGLEFDAVFLARLEEGQLPIKQAKTRAAIDEERRLLYVGITRARRSMCITWRREAKPSRFLAELGVRRVAASPAAARPAPAEADDPAFRALRSWRLRRAQEDGVPAYVVFHDSTLAEIVRRAPGSPEELAGVPGVGPTKLERYAGEVLDTLRSAAVS